MKSPMTIVAKLLPFAAFALAFGFSFLWMLAPARQGALEVMVARGWLSPVAALKDPDSAVATRACTWALTQPDQQDNAAIVAALSERPDVALECLGELNAAALQENPPDDEGSDTDARDPGTAPDLVPFYRIVAGHLGHGWMRALHEQDSAQCANADQADRALRHAGIDPAPGFMSCALAAHSADARQCCVQALGGPTAFARLLDAPHSHPPAETRRHLQAYVTHAFAPEAAQAKPAQDTILQTATQDWVVQVGCDLHRRHPDDTQVIRAFIPIIESKSCAPTDPPSQGYYSSAAWTETCTELYAHQRQALKRAPRQALCKALQGATLAQTIDPARVMLSSALTTAARTAGSAAQSDLTFVAVRDHHRGTTGAPILRAGPPRTGSSRVLGGFFNRIIGR